MIKLVESPDYPGTLDVYYAWKAYFSTIYPSVRMFLLAGERYKAPRPKRDFRFKPQDIETWFYRRSKGRWRRGDIFLIKEDIRLLFFPERRLFTFYKDILVGRLRIPTPILVLGKRKKLWALRECEDFFGRKALMEQKDIEEYYALLDKWEFLKPCARCPAVELCKKERCRRSIQGYLAVNGLYRSLKGNDWLKKRIEVFESEAAENPGLWEKSNQPYV